MSVLIFLAAATLFAVGVVKVLLRREKRRRKAASAKECMEVLRQQPLARLVDWEKFSRKLKESRKGERWPWNYPAEDECEPSHLNRKDTDG